MTEKFSVSEYERFSADLSYVVNDVKSFVKISNVFGEGMREFLERISPHAVCVITDQNVSHLYENDLRSILDNLPGHQMWCRIIPGEESKTLATVQDILEEIWPHMTRDSLIIAFGGGVVGNIAGTVASLIFRGCDFIHVPTTFMAQADSAIGIKQAVNGKSAKNAYGSYHTPLAVFNYLKLLDTLSVDHLRNGLAESIKVAIARSPEFTLSLKELLLKFPSFSRGEMQYIIGTTIFHKINGLTNDPYEKNSLLFLEIGHTVGHAIEYASDFLIHHGEAIAIGMLVEARIGIRLDITSEETYRSLDELLSILAFPKLLPTGVDINKILHYIKCDNRRTSSGPLFVFPTTLGQTVTRSKIDCNLIRVVLESFYFSN
jgi:3-dehydroquinate synthase